MLPTSVTTYSFTNQGASRFFLLRNILVPALLMLILIRVGSDAALIAMIIGGQVHFLSAYIAQARAGKVSRNYLIVACITALAFLFYFVVSGEIIPLAIAIGVTFAIHFAHDEFTLHDERWTAAKITTFVNFALLFTVLVVSVVFGILWPLVLVGGLTVLGVCVRLIRRGPTPSRAEWYLWYLSALIFFVVLTIPDALPLVTKFIILLHYLNWMIGYGIKVRLRPERRNQYWQETIFSLIFVGGAYAALAVTGGPFFSIFFSLAAFYSWAIAHIILSAYLVLMAHKASV